MQDLAWQRPVVTWSQAKDLAGRKIVAVIPAYNEERFIGSVVLKARRYADIVLVVDDGSCDATAEVAEAAGAIVMRHSFNRGKGMALNTAFYAALAYAPEVVVALDADGQHSPEQIARMVTPVLSGEADLVVGSRYLTDTSQVPRYRIWGHRCFNWVTHMASGIDSSDSQSGFRAFSPRALEAIRFYSAGFSVESEMQFLAHEHHLRLAEVPITVQYLDRPKRNVFSQGMTVLGGVIKLTGQYRPLFYFGLPGMLSLLAGLAWGLWVIERFNRTQTLAVGYALICVLLSVMGIVLLSTGIILHSVRGLLLDLLRNRHADK
jgi:glycosyltransferase involved in cell wall biosynthesis